LLGGTGQFMKLICSQGLQAACGRSCCGQSLKALLKSPSLYTSTCPLPLVPSFSTSPPALSSSGSSWHMREGKGDSSYFLVFSCILNLSYYCQDTKMLTSCPLELPFLFFLFQQLSLQAMNIMSLCYLNEGTERAVRLVEEPISK
jgi:hypothetical protein